MSSPSAAVADAGDLPGLVQFARAQYALVRRLAQADDAHEIGLTTTRHLLLVRLLGGDLGEPPFCVLVALDRRLLALGSARMKLAELAEGAA